MSIELPPWPQLSEAAITAAEAVLRSGRVNYWTGSKGMEFEERFAAWQGSRFAVSTCNGTAALHTALSALGIGPGDEVIVPSYTFIASSFAIVQCGAIPRFADVNREDHCISPASARALINDRTRAILVVHLYGTVCDLDPILALAREHGLFVVEDNAEALGGEYKGRKTGSLGDIAATSFCQNKTFTTGGEGGMVTTDDEDLAWTCRQFRDHGYNVKLRLERQRNQQDLPYAHDMVGWNYRLTEMQSAIGLAELARLDSWNLPARRRNAAIIMERLAPLPEVLLGPVDTPDRRNGFFILPFSLDLEAMGCTIEAFMAGARADGLPVRFAFTPDGHRERAYREHRAFGRTGFPFTSPHTDPDHVRYDTVRVSNADWHKTHTFACFAHPTYEPAHCRQIADALVDRIRNPRR